MYDDLPIGHEGRSRFVETAGDDAAEVEGCHSVESVSIEDSEVVEVKVEEKEGENEEKTGKDESYKKIKVPDLPRVEDVDVSDENGTFFVTKERIPEFLVAVLNKPEVRCTLAALVLST